MDEAQRVTMRYRSQFGARLENRFHPHDHRQGRRRRVRIAGTESSARTIVEGSGTAEMLLTSKSTLGEFAPLKTTLTLFAWPSDPVPTKLVNGIASVNGDC